MVVSILESATTKHPVPAVSICSARWLRLDAVAGDVVFTRRAHDVFVLAPLVLAPLVLALAADSQPILAAEQP